MKFYEVDFGPEQETDVACSRVFSPEDGHYNLDHCKNCGEECNDSPTVEEGLFRCRKFTDTE